MRVSPLALPCFAAALLGAGCAFTPDVIRLEPVTRPASRVPGAEAITVRLTVADLRPDASDVVARKINGWGYQMAEITSDVAVAEVLVGAVADGLGARGYVVSDDGRAPLTVELLVFSHEFRTGFWAGRSEALVTFLATVRDPSGRELFREVVAEPFAHPIQLASGANAKKAYEGALSAAVERLVASEPFQRALALAASPPVL